MGESKETQSGTEEMEEDTARGELVFDPETRTYDARKMKVTNLRENTRITLPRPLNPIHEAMIEVRRKEYNRVFDEYRGKESKKRKRVSNLTEEESKGVKSLKSRIEKDEIVVLKTDKSSKLTVMNKEEYRETGEKLREKDRKVDREEIVKREKTLNEHSEFWSRMTRAGENMEHNKRIINSRTSKSNNTANLYYLHKDHKKEIKFRDVASGSTSSNTLGLSNAISELVEAISSSAVENYEVISGEDMLASVEKVNKEFKETEGMGNETTSPEKGNLEEPEQEENEKGNGRNDKKCSKINENRLYMIGFDAVALYPSMKAMNTARICRDQVVEIVGKGDVKLKGLDMKKVALYVRMNKKTYQ